MQTRNGNLIVADLVKAPETQGTWGLQHETRDRGCGQGDTEGEPVRMEVANADGSSRLSMAVAVSVGARGGTGMERSSWRESRTHPTQETGRGRYHILATGTPRGGSSQPSGSAARQRKSEPRGVKGV
jgi:hypothetical protein